MAAQPDLFGDEQAAPKAYIPDPRHVRNRLQSLLDDMRASAAWPWEPVIVSLYHDTVLPQLYGELPDREEAARWRASIEAETARLDAS